MTNIPFFLFYKIGFLSTLSDFRLASGVLGHPIFGYFLKTFSFSVKLETSDFDRPLFGFGVFSGSYFLVLFSV